MSNGKSAALRRVFLVKNNCPAVSFSHCCAGLIRKQNQRFAVCYQFDSSGLRDSRDLHRQRINVIIKQALPCSIAALLIKPIDSIQILSPRKYFLLSGLFLFTQKSTSASGALNIFSISSFGLSTQPDGVLLSTLRAACHTLTISTGFCSF